MSTEKSNNIYTGQMGNRPSEPIRARGRNADRSYYKDEMNSGAFIAHNISQGRDVRSRTYNEAEQTWKEQRNANPATNQ